MGVVGLAQNFAALRALSTDGIQQNHMNLHARSVASTAGVAEEVFETVVESLIESGEIKVWKAREIAKNLSRQVAMPETAERQSAYGKIVLLGEHAVVYGRPAIALPIPIAVEAAVRKEGDGINVLIPRWGIEQRVRASAPGFAGIIATMLSQLGLAEQNMTIEVFPHIPRAMGLGGSSALAVAILRAVDHAFDLKLTDGRINDLAFECEKTAHGTPSDRHRGHLRRATALSAPARTKTATSNLHQGRTRSAAGTGDWYHRQGKSYRRHGGKSARLMAAVPGAVRQPI